MIAQAAGLWILGVSAVVTAVVNGGARAVIPVWISPALTAAYASASAWLVALYVIA